MRSSKSVDANADGNATILIRPVNETGRVVAHDETCTVRLLNVSDWESEIWGPCEEPFAPPYGRYSMWIESDTFISLTSTAIAGGGVATNPGSGAKLDVPVVPLAIVRLESGVSWPRNASFRVLCSAREGLVFDRKAVTEAEARKGIPCPVGSVVGGLFDSDGNAIALGDPVRATATNAAEVRPVAPREGGGLLAVVSSHIDRDDELEMTLTAGGVTYRPATIIVAPPRAFAIWTAIPSGEAEFHASWGRTLTSQPVTIRENAFSTVRTVLSSAK